MVNSPVLFLIFNRLETTRKVFQAIRQAQPSRLYIAADGARATRPEEEEKVLEVRRYVLENIDWPSQVTTLFRDENLGCNPAVTSAITWFFEQESEGIILEDDCLPAPSFFPYCDELLQKYRENDRVMCISGDNFTSPFWQAPESYYFTQIIHIWGWATWRRAWQKNSMDLEKEWIAAGKKFSVGNLLDSHIAKRFWKQKFDLILNHKKISWDFKWLYAIWLSKGISCSPKVNLISNLGFGADATLAANPDDVQANLPIFDLDFPLKHPETIAVAENADGWEHVNVYGAQSVWAETYEDFIRVSNRKIRNFLGLNPVAAKKS